MYLYSSKIECKLYWTMVGTKHISMNLGINQFIVQRFRSYEIVNTPPRILLSSLEAIRPPRVDILLIRIEIAESIRKAGFEKFGHLCAFFIGEACVLTISLGVLQVNLFCRYIQVTTHDNRFLFIKL
mgnify:CR=1 FL=1